MKYEVVGIQRKTGVFTNKDTGKSYNYDNLNLHCFCKNMDVTGCAVREVKLPVEKAGELVAAVGGDWKNIVGHTIDMEFGAYGKLVAYELVS